MTLWDAFVRHAGLEDPDLRSTVLAVSTIPYGRPATLSPLGVLEDRRGTCSTKHLLLQALVQERWPSVDVELWHRVYRLTPELAAASWGHEVARAVPDGGLVDVHTFARALLRERVTLDVTFAVADWDGHSPMAVASGPGEDHPAGHDPLATKRQLVAQHCDPTQREPFIAALARSSSSRRRA